MTFYEQINDEEDDVDDEISPRDGPKSKPLTEVSLNPTKAFQRSSIYKIWV